MLPHQVKYLCCDLNYNSVTLSYGLPCDKLVFIYGPFYNHITLTKFGPENIAATGTVIFKFKVHYNPVFEEYV